MSGNMPSTTGQQEKEASSNNHSWLSWCRLCAKPNDAEQEDIFTKNNTGLCTSIGKYFWVNIKAEDEISKSICKECHRLIDELTVFTERVNKVQTMYCLLQNLKPTSVAESDKLRTQCGLIEGWEHIIKEEVQVTKLTTVHQEVQTDLVIFFNNTTQGSNKSVDDNLKINEKQDLQKPVDIEEEEMVMDIEHEPEQTFEYILQDPRYKKVSEGSRRPMEDSPKKKDQEVLKKRHHDKKEMVTEVEQEPEQTFEYLVQNDDELVEVEEHVFIENNTKLKMHSENQEPEDDADLEDSDLFKELKFKVEENYEEDIKYGRNESKGENDDYHEIHQLEDDNGSDDLEEYVEMEDDEDYEEIIDTYPRHQDESSSTFNAFELLEKRKRGRPAAKPGQRSTSSVYRYECVECKRKYKNPTVYRKHMQSTHDVIIEHLPDFECPECRKDCFNQSRLKLHMRQHLPEEKKLLVPCPYCDRKFSQVGAMRQHVNGIHHELKPYICDQCGRACKTLAALNEHQLVHTDECPFECDVCKKGFKNKARLKSHMDTHNESEYACPDCGLKLNTKRTLLQHRLVHSDVMRFKCEFCDAAFKRSKSLKNHLLLHSGLRPYKCQFCDRSFSNGSNCRSHKRRVHPKELAEEEALGKKNEPVPIPKLEDLKAAKSAIVQPRRVKRQACDFPGQIRKIIKAENRRQNPEDSDDTGMDSYELSDIHYEIEGEMEDDDMDDHQDVDGCEETVIYEIIDEI